MKYPIRETLAIICDAMVPVKAWQAIVALCRSANPGAPWEELPPPDIEADVIEALVPGQVLKLGLRTAGNLGTFAQQGGSHAQEVRGPVV